MSNNDIDVKSEDDIKKIIEGGRKLSKVKNKLKKEVKEGISAEHIDKLADKTIKELGGKASFKMVDKYDWATCVNVNEGVVHGIPHKSIVFEKGDVVSVDVGMFYKGFHTDTSFTVAIEPDEDIERFLEIGKKTLNLAIEQAKPGNKIYDISKATEDALEKEGLTPIRALVGHGIGKSLHEEPQIPNYTHGNREDSPEIPEGAVFAIEIMYAQGRHEVQLEDDGWTISTRDGTISALYEDTVVVSKDGPIIVTR